MAGFPTRVSRAAFGPAFENKRSVVNVNKELGKDTVELFAWQVSGMNVVSPIAFATVIYDGANYVLDVNEEAWDPNGSGAAPVLSRAAAGNFRLTYLASYTDNAGNTVTTNLRAAKVVPNVTTDIVGVAEVQSDKRVIEIRLRNGSTRALTDAPFAIWIY